MRPPGIAVPNAIGIVAVICKDTKDSSLPSCLSQQRAQEIGCSTFYTGHLL